MTTSKTRQEADALADKFINSMEWSAGTTEDEKNRVVGNIRGFAILVEMALNEYAERNRMLRDIALSAIALKLNIEHGFPPTLDALNRDLAAYDARFKSAMVRPANYNALSEEEDKRLGILDLDGK